MAEHLIILGGGIIGLSCAFEAVRQGFRVTVVEQGALGGQASGAAAGMLAPFTENPDQPDAFFGLCRESLRLYPEWVRQIESVSGMRAELVATGSLTAVLHEADLLPLQTRLAWQQREGAREAELIEQGKRLRAMEPLLSDKVQGALFCPNEQHVNAPRLVAALAEACRRLGAELVEQAGVVELPELSCAAGSVAGDSGKGVLVRTSKKGDFKGERLVVCTGAWASQLAETFGLPLPIHPIRGQICAYDVPYGYTHHMVFSSQAYWVGKRNGTLVCGASEDVAGYDTTVTERGIERLMRWGPRLFPFLEGKKVVHSWAGLRPATRDGWPLIGELPGRPDILIAAGHYRNGILLSPVTASLIGSLLSGQTGLMSNTPFTPNRFAAVSTRAMNSR